MQREREIFATLAQQRERELAATLAHQQQREIAAALGPPPHHRIQARRSALALAPAQQRPVLRPSLPVPTGHGRGRSRSADSGCNVEGCPRAKRAM